MYEGSYNEEQIMRPQPGDVSGLAVGFILFASAIMVMVGTFHFIGGLAAVLDGDFYNIRSGYDMSMGVNTWGWIHIVGGTLMVIGGTFLITGMLWARILAMALAVISAIWSFYSIPYYPLWSILIIAFDIGVLWALIAHGKEMEV
jgi:hypothetical protein